jgi:type II pantothenate kinase
MILGIDFGSSYTDFVILDKDKVTYSKSIATEQLDLDKALEEIPWQGVELIKATGFRAVQLPEELHGLPVQKVNELEAIGKGGLKVSNLDKALVASVGSGTCLVSANNNSFEHVGGTAIGGKTLQGLAQLLLNTRDVKEIEKLAEQGNAEKVDLTLKQLYPQGIGLLDAEATAAHFGNLDAPSREDLALALLNLVGQAIGTTAALAAKAEKQSAIVFTGRLINLKPVRQIIEGRVSRIFAVKCLVPEQSKIATALGAALD